MHRIDPKVIAYGEYIEENIQKLFLYPSRVLSLAEWMAPRA